MQIKAGLFWLPFGRLKLLGQAANDFIRLDTNMEQSSIVIQLIRRRLSFRHMYGLEINPLIQNAVKKHCDDTRLAKVIMDLLNETNQQQHHGRLDWQQYFKKRYRESILTRFWEELRDA